ncbi:MAG: ester cyclase [Pseudomonadota bacterium]
MEPISDTAVGFVEACDSGKGWAACAEYCTPNASFSAQCEVLEGVDTVEGYCAWMADLLQKLPDGRIEMKSLGVDEARGHVTLFSVFKGTHTGAAGPVPPTGRSTAADYVYAMEFRGGRLSHLTKIWNAPWTLRELGWA